MCKVFLLTLKIPPRSTWPPASSQPMTFLTHKVSQGVRWVCVNLLVYEWKGRWKHLKGMLYPFLSPFSVTCCLLPVASVWLITCSTVGLFIYFVCCFTCVFFYLDVAILFFLFFYIATVFVGLCFFFLIYGIDIGFN